jgi:thioredoxin-like negative regulator of GroEL
VEFYTPSVESCKRIDPYIESSCRERGVHLIRANTDKVPNIRNMYDIDIIPTFLVMDKDGKVIDRS